MRLTLAIHSMTNGGAERVMSTMANAWTARGHDVTLLTFDDGREPPFYPLDPRVDHRPLGIASTSPDRARAAVANLQRLRTIRAAVAAADPDVVISLIDWVNVRVLAATRGLSVPVVVMEQTDPAAKQNSRVWNALRRLTYPRAARLVVLSEESRAFFPPVIQEKTVIIPNPIAVEGPPAPAIRSTNGPRILAAMGRLAPEKGFDLLLDAFGSIAGEVPGWRLVIHGEGPLRADLEARRARLGLDAAVDLPGRTTRPFEALRAADLFVMSSRREGFPLALGEAMALGLPAVSFDCPSGPRQLIRHEVDGLLVPDGDVAALAAALCRLMTDDADRCRLAARAPDARDRFGAERIMDRWDDLLREVAAGGWAPRDRRGGPPCLPFSSPRTRERADTAVRPYGAVRRDPMGGK